MDSNEICQRAFTEVEIHPDGNVYTCCPNYLNFFDIGNIFDVKSFDEIWYSNRAKELRRSIINNEYKYCNTIQCNKKTNDNYSDFVENPPYPKLVRISYDCQCNLRCMFCRDNLIVNSKEQNEKFNNMTESFFLPILKNAELMSITSNGEITSSSHSINFLKKAAKMYPNLKFEILTNAMLFNENFYNSLNLKDRIYRIVISMHAMEKNTYEHIMRGANYDIVRKNIEQILKLKENGEINEICIVFTAFSLNYKEIPKFVKFAIDNRTSPIIWEYRNFHRTKMDKNYSKYAVWKKTHPQYNDFVKIIKEIDQKYKDSVYMPQLLKELEYIPKSEEYKNKVKSIFHLK